MNISELVKTAHENAVEKGFYENPREIGTLLMLVVSELGEALEADRNNRRAEWKSVPFAGMVDVEKLIKGFDQGLVGAENYFRENVKETFEDELADAVIRICDLAGYLKIDLESHIIAKMAYNKTRDKKHGKEY